MSRNFSQRDFDDLLDRHLRNQTTPAEEKLIVSWLENLAEHESDKSEEDNNNTKATLWRGIEKEIQKDSRHPVVRSYPNLLAIAATVLILIAACVFIFLNHESKSTVQPIAGLRAADWNEIRNTGQRTLKVDLPDGSKVLLRPNSVLHSAITPTSAERILKLKGEAFFDVAHDKNRPFVVFSEQIVTRVLGTRFTIRAQGPSEKVTVVVNSGRVAVSNPNRKSEVVLVEDQKVVYDPLEGSFAQNAIEKKDDERTTQNLSMKFDEEPVSNILDLLEKKYFIDIDYDEELLLNCLVTTAFYEEGLYERLTITAKIIGASYTIDNGKVIFKSTGCN